MSMWPDFGRNLEDPERTHTDTEKALSNPRVQTRDL